MSAQKTFCNYPFHHIATDTTGQYRLCCESKNLAPFIQDMSLSSWWNSDVMNEIRAKMLKGEEVEACVGCYRQEKKGLLSKRIKPQIEFSEVKIDVESPRLQSFDLRPSNQCNSLCASCDSSYSSAITKEYQDLQKENALPKFLQDQDRSYTWSTNDWSQIFSYAKQLKHVYISGGEPFLLKQLSEFLEILPAKCAIAMNTNATVYNKDLVEKLKKFEIINIGFSIDGVGDRYNFLRYPGNFTKFKRNVLKMAQELNQGTFELNVTVYSYNIDQVIPIYKFAEEFQSEDVKIRIVWNKLISPSYLSVLNVPFEVRKSKAQEIEAFLKVNKELVESTKSEFFIYDILCFMNLNQDESLSWQAIYGRDYLELLSRRRQFQFTSTVEEIRELITPYGKTKEFFV